MTPTIRGSAAGLITAVGFLTRVPVPTVVEPEPGAGAEPGTGPGAEPRSGPARRTSPVTAAVPWFPFVGSLIGAVGGGAYLALGLFAPSPVAAGVAVASTLLVTGAFHHDGLADIADAFGGGWTREERLEILKDSRLGTYGTSALTMALIVEVAAIASLKPLAGLRFVVVAHCLSRAVAVATMWFTRHRPAGPESATGATPGATSGGTRGLGATYTAGLTPIPIAVSVVLALGVGLVVAPDRAAVVLGLAGAAVVAAAVVALARSKIGAVTGDVLGAVQVLSLLTLLVVAASSATG